MSKPTEEDRSKYPHITLTSEMDWDPGCMDHTYTHTDGELKDPYDALIDEHDPSKHFTQSNFLTEETIHPADESDHNQYDPLNMSHDSLSSVKYKVNGNILSKASQNRKMSSNYLVQEDKPTPDDSIL